MQPKRSSEASPKWKKIGVSQECRFVSSKYRCPNILSLPRIKGFTATIRLVAVDLVFLWPEVFVHASAEIPLMTLYLEVKSTHSSYKPPEQNLFVAESVTYECLGLVLCAALIFLFVSFPLPS